MNTFTRTAIQDALSIGKYLQQRREKYGATREEIAEALSISKKNIESIEEDRIEEMPEAVYGELILRRYGEYLGFDLEVLMARYQNKYRSFQQRNSFMHARNNHAERAQFFFPAIVWTRSILFLFLTACFGYLCFLGYQTFMPPKLTIETPLDNIASYSNTIIVSGKTVRDAEVRINGEIVIKDVEGKFQQAIGLQDGINMIRISAVKKHSSERNVLRTVIFHQVATAQNK